MTILLWILAAGFVAAMILFFAPINIALNFAYRKHAPLVYGLSAAFVSGVICKYKTSSSEKPQLKIFGIAIKRKKKIDGVSESDNGESETEKKSITSRMVSASKKFHAGDTFKRMIKRPNRGKVFLWLARVPRRVLRAFSLKRASVHIVLGSCDPAYVGKTFGHFEAARHALLAQTKRVNLSMTPVWTEERTEAEIDIALRTSIGTMLYHALVIALTFPKAKKNK